MKIRQIFTGQTGTGGKISTSSTCHMALMVQFAMACSLGHRGWRHVRSRDMHEVIPRAFSPESRRYSSRRGLFTPVLAVDLSDPGWEQLVLGYLSEQTRTIVTLQRV